MQIATLTDEQQMPENKRLDRATVEQWAAEAREDLPSQLGTDFDELEVMLAVARRASSAAVHVQKSLIAELEADNESLRRINDDQDKALATLEAQIAAAPQAEQAAVAEDVARARLIAKEAAKFSNDTTHLGNLVYVNDLVWALAILAAHPAQGVPASVGAAPDVLSALIEARSVLSSINRGDMYLVKVGDDVCYWQRDEWVQWAVKEVLPLVEAAIAATQPAAHGMDAQSLADFEALRHSVNEWSAAPGKEEELKQAAMLLCADAAALCGNVLETGCPRCKAVSVVAGALGFTTAEFNSLYTNANVGNGTYQARCFQVNVFDDIAAEAKNGEQA